jgi:RHS repeat-associated protein
VGSFLTGATYDGIGQVTGTTLGNGVTESYGYDANRMQLTTQTATAGINSLMNLTYNYQGSAGQMGTGTIAGNAGQLMSVSGTMGGLPSFGKSGGQTTESAVYKYDDLGRLVSSNQTSNGSSAQRRFTYDRWGNRTGVWDATSGGNQIQSITLQQSGGAPTNQIASVTANGVTKSYVYDANGSLTSDGVHTYDYDAENRLKGVDGGATAAYDYDYQNRRIKKLVGATSTHYVWECNQVVAEHNGSTGAVLTDYVYSGSRLIAQVTSGMSGTTQYFLSDRLSERMVLSASGSVLGRMAHLPFGEDFAKGGSQEKHHFTSYETDSESALHYAVNRYYSSSTGRFLSADPYRLMVVITVLLMPQAVTDAQTKRPHPIKSSGAVSETEVMALAHRLGTARADMTAAATNYKDSLRKLMMFQENDVKTAADTIEKRKALLAENIISKKEVEESEHALTTAQSKVEDTKKQIADADDLIAEAQADEANSMSYARRLLAEKKKRERTPTGRVYYFTFIIVGQLTIYEY